MHPGTDAVILVTAPHDQAPTLTTLIYYPIEGISS